MKKWLLITNEPIDERALTMSRMMSADMGTALYFAGVVRQSEGAARIAAIEYEAFQEMAEHQFEKIFVAIEQKWPIESIRIVHRIGLVKVNEPSLWVEVIAPHRGEAFAACKFLIDEMKRLVPIWKRPRE
ncbi:MAG: molybdenum cofactor biosynthesis protein MoaE [Verrucomicrobia subdivision 3 bacterium]|nr:molybdenum cofactor biosynthesis protein MoaE [Limisphaerales bacterium]